MRPVDRGGPTSPPEHPDPSAAHARADDGLHGGLLDVSDLVERPGARREVARDLGVLAGRELPLLEVVGAVHVSAVLESLVDGVLLRGTVAAEAHQWCARCLVRLDATISAEVVELFADPSAPDAEAVEEGYEIRDGVIDLERLVRDAVLPASAYRPLCDPECAGLCSGCGADLNRAACTCRSDEVDPRWQALQRLRDDA